MSKEVLIKVRELLSDPSRWTQRCSARDCNGNPAHESGEEPVAFCLFGAMTRVTGGLDVYKDLSEILYDRWCISIPAWNDAPGRTHAEVLALLDKAIDAYE